MIVLKAAQEKVLNALQAVSGIVEYKDCTPTQATIQEINPGYYCYRAADLLWSLEHITNHNAKGEYYLTDTIEILRRQGHMVEAVVADNPLDTLGVNTQEELAEVAEIMERRSRDPAKLRSV